jgi:hypothetical protein
MRPFLRKCHIFADSNCSGKFVNMLFSICLYIVIFNKCLSFTDQSASIGLVLSSGLKRISKDWVLPAIWNIQEIYHMFIPWISPIG